MATAFDELFCEAKEYINFTWNDPVKDKQVNGFVLYAKQYLSEVAGKDIDFKTDFFAKQLLLDCVLYLDSRAFPDFSKNYNSELNELRIKYGVADSI